MTDHTATAVQAIEEPQCSCYECLTKIEIARERRNKERLVAAIQQVADIIEEYPPLWTWGDGCGGYVSQLLQEAMEARGMRGYSGVWQPRSEVVRLAERDGWDCHYCGVALEGKPDRPRPHVDHVFSKSRGGSNGLENKVLACPTCNIAKGARTPQEWLGGA